MLTNLLGPALVIALIRDIRHDKQGVSDDLYDFLQAFCTEHPEFVDNDFYLKKKHTHPSIYAFIKLWEEWACWLVLVVKKVTDGGEFFTVLENAINGGCPVG
ncbi:serine carboxypeptidase precursor [Artemisia annua]|uniref:Serine carboxypeptidase n=1 Tax=Artemisia annua TaxID=35608 RepID=A0A2U1NJZ2_ARTAN|nr:serine carboxypeptidase precursor [Artemisia annua]